MTHTSNTPMVQRTLFALVLALVGPICAIALALLARLVAPRLSRGRT